MIRQPIVAGQFYPSDADVLMAQVRSFLAEADPRSGKGRTLLAMAPHAGYVFSGRIAGKTLGQADLASTILLLGPNHTGMGGRFGVWPSGRWNIPGGGLDVDAELADALVQAEPRLTSDVQPHLREHSLEVLIPFLAAIDPETRIVPVTVAESSLDALLQVGAAVGRTLKGWQVPVSLVVSSDMSHYLSDIQARELDKVALDAALSLDPCKFYETVRNRRISMCGVFPMTLALAVLGELGGECMARLVAYGTSADASGDFDRVVGYAGMLVE
ncbi:MAG: AmmeMemoRadiSam system protein B [Desulfovibrionaceae bacterium]